jgi:hypothetical protein
MIYRLWLAVLRRCAFTNHPAQVIRREAGRLSDLNAQRIGLRDADRFREGFSLRRHSLDRLLAYAIT